MSAPKFTPGPWTVAPCCNNPEHTAEPWGLRVQGPHRGSRHWYAPDAHLISAAPDLYAVVEAAVAAWGSLDTSSLKLWEANLLIVARAALAKARGEA